MHIIEKAISKIFFLHILKLLTDAITIQVVIFQQIVGFIIVNS